MIHSVSELFHCQINMRVTVVAENTKIVVNKLYANAVVSLNTAPPNLIKKKATKCGILAYVLALRSHFLNAQRPYAYY